MAVALKRNSNRTRHAASLFCELARRVGSRGACAGNYKIVSLLANVKFCGFANDYRDALMEQRTTVRIAQFDIVGTGSKGVFLGLLDPIREAAIHSKWRLAY